MHKMGDAYTLMEAQATSISQKILIATQAAMLVEDQYLLIGLEVMF